MERMQRYQVSLTRENVDEFRDHCKAFRLPKSQMSATLDDFLKEMNQFMRSCREKGKFTIADLFEMMGRNIMESLEDENAKQTPKAEGVAKRIAKK